MTDKKDIWKSRYYRILRTYMSLLGIWPYDRLCKRYIRFIPTFIFSFSILIPQLAYTVAIASDFNDVIDSVTSAIISIIFSFKIASIMFDKNVSNNLSKFNVSVIFLLQIINRLKSMQMCLYR
ncbi:uncharacterized protein LOC114255590 [Monomorium pharaonis]|uniref:uncharacterized protein LOC114255590 n=1 Tax=Monomorium pharaonis TaxID=307658 RepID=UPI0017461DF4|nr:uncharacterized protein LOC114255590 [Monomorium pharaonis]